MSRSRRDVWAERMARYQNSSLTVKEFCASESISLPSFYQWKRKLASAKNAPAKDSPAFVSVSLNHACQLGAPTLRLPGGATIELEPTWDDDGLRRIIRAVVDVTLNKAAYDETIR